MDPPAPYCDTCFAIFKIFDSCPDTRIFDGEAFLPKALEVIWVSASLIPYTVYGALAFYALFARSSRVLFLLISLLLQQFLNDEILKRIFAEHRPPGACSLSYGLPSGHSSFSGSWALFLTLEWLLYHDKVPFKASRFHEPLRIVGILVIPLIPISRYFLNYHSPKQIFSGLLTGFIITSLSFYAVMALIHKDNGKLWGSKIVKQFKKWKVKDNIVLYGSQLDDLMSSQVDLEQPVIQQDDTEGNSSTLGKETMMILPLKDAVRYYFWEKVAETSKVLEN